MAARTAKFSDTIISNCKTAPCELLSGHGSVLSTVDICLERCFKHSIHPKLSQFVNITITAYELNISQFGYIRFEFEGDFLDEKLTIFIALRKMYRTNN